MHLPTFIGNCASVVAALVILGACGWFTISPFRQVLRFPVLVAPFAGVLMLSLTALAGYVFLKLPLYRAGLLGMAMAVGLSLCALEWNKLVWDIRRVFAIVMVGLAISVVVVRMTMATSHQFAGAAMLYADGTDHLGYAHLADWLSTHLVTERPVMDSTRPYDSWPNLLLQIDPRFGSHAFLALVALASGHSAMFAYDLGTAIALAVMILAVAGVYADSKLSFGMLIAGLLTCYWFEYGRTGYLGKLLGYPSAFIIAGIYMRSVSLPSRVVEMVCLAALAASGAIMHSALALALFVGLLGAVCLVGEFVCNHIKYNGNSRFPRFHDKIASLALVIAAALLASGTLARPLNTIYPDWNLQWTYILPRVADLENQGVAISGFPDSWLPLISAGLLGIGLAGGLAALVFRVPAAVALLLGPLLLLGALYLQDERAAAFQLIGTLYPLGLCGLTLLYDTLSGRPDVRLFPLFPAFTMARLIYVAAVVAIGLHVPRFVGALARYGGPDTPRLVRFSEKQMNGLAEIIGPNTVDVDIANSPQLNIALLVELGRKGISLQWSPDSWRQILGYQPWAHPVYPNPGKFVLVVAGQTEVPPGVVRFQTEQYLLLSPVGNSPEAR